MFSFDHIKKSKVITCGASKRPAIHSTKHRPGIFELNTFVSKVTLTSISIFRANKHTQIQYLVSRLLYFTAIKQKKKKKRNSIFMQTITQKRQIPVDKSSPNKTQNLKPIFLTNTTCQTQKKKKTNFTFLWTKELIFSNSFQTPWLKTKEKTITL